MTNEDLTIKSTNMSKEEITTIHTKEDMADNGSVNQDNIIGYLTNIRNDGGDF